MKKYYIIAGILIYALMLLFALNRHSKTGIHQYGSELWADKSGYYVYLPATFIYHWDESKIPSGMDTLLGTGFGMDTIRHKITTKYPYCVALLQSPFWLVAHLLSPEKDGFSLYYYRATNFSAVFYYLIGIGFIFFYLRRSFTKTISALSCMFLTFGTGLLYYTCIEGAMSHVYSFAAFAALLYYISINKFDSKKYYIIIGVLSGLIFMLRPINIIFLGLVLLIAGVGKEGIMGRLKNLLDKRMFLYGLPFAILFIIPQLCYNYYLTGHITLDTYSDEKFIYLSSPKIAEVAMAPCNGLFLYYPLILFVLLIAVFKLKKHKAALSIPIGFTLIYIFLYASWWAYQLGCGFGHRAFVDILPFFALPIALSLVGRFKYFFAGLYILCMLYTFKLTIALYGCYFGNGDWDWAWFSQLITNPIN